MMPLEIVTVCICCRDLLLYPVAKQWLNVYELSQTSMIDEGTQTETFL